MKIKGGILDGDGHLIERDAELLEYMDAPYKGNNTGLRAPSTPSSRHGRAGSGQPSVRERR